MRRTITAAVLAISCLVPIAFAGTLSMSPAGLSLKGLPRQSATQTFTVANLTDTAFTVTVDVSDVLVRDGKRVFLPAGQLPGSIASLTSVPTREFSLNPGERRAVAVTFVLPAETSIRAVAVFVHALPQHAAEHARIRLNLGAVIDFSISNEVVVRPSQPQAIPPSSGTNAVITQQFDNVGPEPTIIRGIAAILDPAGRLVGKTMFDQRRLLPGERNVVRAEYAGTLAPGKYHVVCSLEYSDRTLTGTTELTVP